MEKVLSAFLWEWLFVEDCRFVKVVIDLIRLLINVFGELDDVIYWYFYLEV